VKVPEAARFFKIPRTRMYDLIQKGELPAVHIGQRSIRVDLRECERVLAQKRARIPRLGPSQKVVASAHRTPARFRSR
jgi:excisionase family DNA binding protein